MSSKFSSFILFSISLFTLGCSSDTNDICYSFDQKQCQVDPWFTLNEDVPLQERVEEYLESEGIQVIRIDTEINQGATCLACEVCPDDKKFQVKIDMDGMTRMESLNLLNLTLEACN